MATPELDADWHVHLRRALVNGFGESDLRTLCFDLNVDYDSLPGEGTVDKIVELIKYFARLGKITDLIDYCENARPNVAWDEIRAGALAKPLVVLESEPGETHGAEPPPVRPASSPPPPAGGAARWVRIGGLIAVVVLAGFLAVKFLPDMIGGPSPAVATPAPTPTTSQPEPDASPTATLVPTSSPTTVPSPTPTPVATSVPPTVTAENTVSGVLQATPTSTVPPTTVARVTPRASPSRTPTPCAEGRPDLGCPTSPARAVAMAREPFERGRMIWVGAGSGLSAWEKVIVVLTGEGPDARWQRFPDTWETGQPESDPNAVPPTGLLQPIRGFGKVWRDQYGGASAPIGWATEREKGVTGDIRLYQRGVALRFDDEVVLLTDDYSWRVEK